MGAGGRDLPRRTTAQTITQGEVTGSCPVDRQPCEGCALFHRCPAKLNRSQDGYVLVVDLAAANIERRRCAEAGGEFKDSYLTRAGIEGNKTVPESPGSNPKRMVRAWQRRTTCTRRWPRSHPQVSGPEIPR